MASNSEAKIAKILKIYDGRCSVKSHVERLSRFFPEASVILLMLAGLCFAL